MEVRQRNNNKETLNKEVPNNLVGEQKIKYEKLLIKIINSNVYLYVKLQLTGKIG